MSQPLTSQQTNVLCELLSAGTKRAAASLHELTGKQVSLRPPEIFVCTLDTLADRLDRILGTITCTAVHQIFSGSVSGDALLLLRPEDARILCSLLTGTTFHGETLTLTQAEREVLTEVGNIVLSACLSTWGNLTRVHIRFTVPRIYLDQMQAMLDTLTVEQEEMRYAVVAHSGFELHDADITMLLVIVLGTASLERLFAALTETGQFSEEQVTS